MPISLATHADVILLQFSDKLLGSVFLVGEKVLGDGSVYSVLALELLNKLWQGSVCKSAAKGSVCKSTARGHVLSM